VTWKQHDRFGLK